MKVDIDTIKRKLLVKYPLFGSIVANLKYVAATNEQGVPTAGTDGDTVYYNPEFINHLPMDEQVFTFAHEICHVAFEHIPRAKDKDQHLWNIATDAVINALLKQDGLTLTKGCIDIEGAEKYNAEQMYEKLLQNKQDQEKNKQNTMSDAKSGMNQNNSDSTESPDASVASDKQEQDVGDDTHSMWQNAIKKQEEKNAQQEMPPKRESPFKKEQEKITKMGETTAFQQNKQEKKEQLNKLKDEIAKQSLHDSGDSNIQTRTVNNIGESKPLVDWRRVLKEAIQYDVDWSYQNATIEEGVLTPHLEDIPFPETEILLDTSGSIDETLLRNFLRECKNIIRDSKVKVGCFDTHFYGFQEIRNVKDIDNLEFAGGGGTDFNVAVNAFSNRVENKIIFTDGWAPMPKKPLDAIWIVFGGENINPKGGKVISIDENQLEDLYNLTSNYNEAKAHHSK